MGRRDETEKLAGDSGSRRSIFMVRQFAIAMVGYLESWRDRGVGTGEEQCMVVCW